MLDGLHCVVANFLKGASSEILLKRWRAGGGIGKRYRLGGHLEFSFQTSCLDAYCKAAPGVIRNQRGMGARLGGERPNNILLR